MPTIRKVSNRSRSSKSVADDADAELSASATATRTSNNYATQAARMFLMLPCILTVLMPVLQQLVPIKP